MKILLLTFLSLLFCNLSFADDCKHTKISFKCVKYIRNYDADTITVQIPNVHPLIGEKISIRVYGVDTPEIRGKNKCEKKKANEAKIVVQEILTKAKRIDLLDIKRGKYFRIVANVTIQKVLFLNFSDFILAL